MSLGAELGKPLFSNHTSLLQRVIIVADYSSRPFSSVRIASRGVKELFVMLKSKEIQLPLCLFVLFVSVELTSSFSSSS